MPLTPSHRKRWICTVLGGCRWLSVTVPEALQARTPRQTFKNGAMCIWTTVEASTTPRAGSEVRVTASVTRVWVRVALL